MTENRETSCSRSWGKWRSISCRSSVGCRSFTERSWPEAEAGTIGDLHCSLFHVRAQNSAYSSHGPTIAQLRKEYMLSPAAAAVGTS